MFYVYIYLNPLKSGSYIYEKFLFEYEPFYVGKGKNNRMFYHLYKQKSTNKLKSNIIEKIRKNNKLPIILKLKEFENENDAFEFEQKLIKLIGRRDLKNGPLSNMTNGGEGKNGIIFSEKRLDDIRIQKKVVQFDSIGKIINIWKKSL